MSNNIQDFPKEPSYRKIHTQLALIEQSQDYTHKTLERIEKKIDSLDKKIDRAENKIYSNIRWIVGVSLTTILTVAGVIVEFYQYIKS